VAELKEPPNSRNSLPYQGFNQAAQVKLTMTCIPVTMTVRTVRKSTTLARPSLVDLLGRALAGFCLGWAVGWLVVQPLLAADQTAPKLPSPSVAVEPPDWNTPLSDGQKVLQLLNRITFGPRPGDVERARQMGLEAFLDEQLHPDEIDDAAIESRVRELPTLSMSPEELVENFPEPMKAAKRAREQEHGRPGPGRTPAAPMRAGEPAPQPGVMQADEMQGPRRVIMELAQEEVLRAVYSERQLQEVMVQFWMNHFNIFAPKGADKWLTTSFERDTIRPRTLGKFEDLLVATAKSPAMLFYLDNWMSAAPTLSNTRRRNAYGRQAPRGEWPGRSWRPFGRGVWRRFGGSPTRPPAARRSQPAPVRPNKRGLNENYGRELMELHTLGVTGGYTQRDVIEVARCLTGWTIDRPRQGGEFVFDPRLHDFGEKVVLGHKIKAGHGVEDGLRVLHLLARHPSTARFIALKLCRRFVADAPPPALVARASQTFLHSKGDMRAVLRTILTSPEFYSQAAYRAKVKSPLELVTSSLRALGARTDASLPLLQLIARMGQPMFQYQAPTGFPDRASTWINSGALLMRMNFATQLASNRIRGTQVDWTGLDFAQGAASTDNILAGLNQHLLEGALAAKTRETILKQFENQPAASPGNEGRLQRRDAALAKGWPSNAVATVAALVLASPEFQRR